MAKKIVIASGKGGVGKTTLTVGIGRALAERGRRVLLFDCDTYGSVDLLVGTAENTVFNWGDVILERCNVIDAIKQGAGMSIILCPKTYDGITVQGFRGLIKKLDNMFDYILFDSPAGFDAGFLLAGCAAQYGIVVATPDLVSVNSACAAGEKLRSYGVGDIRMCINRAVRRDM